jgi:2-polyprenyl-6-methoxyphenol hydroxylase-like FAD-dependent oxidoreductase
MASVPQDNHIRADVREPNPFPTISSTTPTHDKQDRPLRLAIVGGAQQALELLGPDVYAADKKQATESPFRICNGQAEGELGSAVLMPPNLRASQSTVHRAQFLDALVELVPSGWAHFDKRLVNIEDKTAKGEKGSLVLNFKDGTTAEADAIIGADGIHSHTRTHVLDDVPDKENYKLNTPAQRSTAA